MKPTRSELDQRILGTEKAEGNMGANAYSHPSLSAPRKPDTTQRESCLISGPESNTSGQPGEVDAPRRQEGAPQQQYR